MRLFLLLLADDEEISEVAFVDLDDVRDHGRGSSDAAGLECPVSKVAVFSTLTPLSTLSLPLSTLSLVSGLVAGLIAGRR